MQMRWRRRDVVIANRCAEASFSFTGKYDAELIEGVKTFKDPGRMLDRLDDGCPAVFWNIRKALWVWRRLGNLLQREGRINKFPPCFIGRWSRQSCFLVRRPGFLGVNVL